ncbi:MAG: methylmalonyl Co-A mutase-associated GTPase MeaB [Niastella sp.]|jgi:LAO/AO transport system kinase|uniref:methylmalonyl Co-A mutase-associated GTPase MeaB n=1 Tax=Niastella sp. TaxID=1869183 RepID=UPI00389AC047
MNWQSLLTRLQQGDMKAIARSISLVENETPGYEILLGALPATSVPIIGITGPPGAGKSTLTDAMIGEWVSQGKRVAVLCVDPSSPFNMGAVLGDRIRMSEWYINPNVFIRSLATRGSLGGLHPKIIEITELLKAAPFDFIIVETVGVGQSEVEIAGLADMTLVVLVPEAGDDIQTMKAGLLEIADLFIVNKSDRPGADQFVKNLLGISSMGNRPIPVLKTIAHERKGIAPIMTAISEHQQQPHHIDKNIQLLTQRALHLIQHKRMQDINRQALYTEIKNAYLENRFNLYQLVAQYA